MSTYIANDEDLGKAYTYSSLDYRVLRIRIQKSSKMNFICEWCDETITPEQGCAYYSVMDLGKFQAYKMCLNCHKKYK